MATATRKRPSRAKPKAKKASPAKATAANAAAAQEVFANSPTPEVVNASNADKAATPDGIVQGRTDNATQRTGGEPLQGGFVTIDRTAKGIDADLLPSGRDGYGVYLEPAEVGKDGYPTKALVRLRDDSHALIVVPFDALTRSEGGHR